MVYPEVDRLLTLDDSNEITGDDSALMDELIERMLPVCSWLSKIYFPCLKRKPLSIHTHTLAITFHRHLPMSILISCASFLIYFGEMLSFYHGRHYGFLSTMKMWYKSGRRLSGVINDSYLRKSQMIACWHSTWIFRISIVNPQVLHFQSVMNGL